MPLIDYLIQPGEMMTPESIDRKRKLALLLQQKGTDTSPVQHWSQGAARLSDALFGALDEVRADKAEKNNSTAINKVMEGLLGQAGGSDASAPATPSTASSMPAGGGGDYFSNMAYRESANNPNAVNKGSGATGLYQFMPGTWRGLMEKYPNLGLTFDGLKDPQQQRVAMERFTQDNAAALKNAGLPVNEATLALAHQQGAGGAIKLLSNPDAPAAQIVGVKAVTGNGGDPNMTAGQFANHVTSYYGYGGQKQPVQTAQAAQAAPADVPAPGAQPAEYQIPGGQPQQAAPAQGMDRLGMMRQISAMWPYMNESQRQQVQMIMQAIPKPMTPLERAQLQNAENQNKLFPYQEAEAKGKVALIPGQIEGQTITNQKGLSDLTDAQRKQQGFRPLVDPQERARYGIDPSDKTPYQVDPYGKMDAVGRPTTNINTTPGPSKQVFEEVSTRAGEARAAAQSLPAFQEASRLINSGNITLGAGADMRVGMQKIGALFGLDATAASNAETFQSAMAPVVLGLVKGLGAGSGISNADRDFAAAAAGGNIKLEPATIRRLIDIGTRAAQAKVDMHNAMIDEVYPEGQQENGQVRSLFRVKVPPFVPPPPPAATQNKAVPAKAPEGVDPKVWEVMTPEEKSLWAN
jgi:hypothetical protein